MPDAHFRNRKDDFTPLFVGSSVPAYPSFGNTVRVWMRNHRCSAGDTYVASQPLHFTRVSLLERAQLKTFGRKRGLDGEI